VGIEEEELRSLPRLRGRGRRAELTTRLEADRRELDTARDRLRRLDAELSSRQGTLDKLKSQAERERSGLEKTCTSPTERVARQLPGLPPAPTHPESHRSSVPTPQLEPRGYGIEL
jgi:hypothetical protein